MQYDGTNSGCLMTYLSQALKLIYVDLHPCDQDHRQVIRSLQSHHGANLPGNTRIQNPRSIRAVYIIGNCAREVLVSLRKRQLLEYSMLASGSPQVLPIVFYRKESRDTSEGYHRVRCKTWSPGFYAVHVATLAPPYSRHRL